MAYLNGDSRSGKTSNKGEKGVGFALSADDVVFEKDLKRLLFIYIIDPGLKIEPERESDVDTERETEGETKG